MWRIFALGFACVIVFFLLVYNGWIGYMPPIEELKNPNDKFATVLYTADGEEMGRYYRNSGNRVYADYSEISQHVIDALIATEDARFEDHSGIDMRAMMRVLVKTLIMQRKNAGGGSTITQQLAKNLFPRDTTSRGPIGRKAKLVVSKFKEWITALKLEYNYTKEEIAAMYLNTVEYGSNAYGIKTAAQTFFNKEPGQLNVQEAAMLVGVVNAPTRLFAGAQSGECADPPQPRAVAHAPCRSADTGAIRFDCCATHRAELSARIAQRRNSHLFP